MVVFSSLHSQNIALNDFMNQESDLPLLSYIPNKVFMATLRMGRDFLSSNAQYDQFTRLSRERENQLLDSTVAIADLQLCAMSRSTGHLWRVMSLLWRSLICGDGEPDLVWANPAASIPLRVHSFASILHLVGTTSLFLAKNGANQVDGVSKLNFVVLGRVLALLFDEKKLFSRQAFEKFDDQYWCSADVRKSGGGSPPSKQSLPTKRKGHIRQTYELGNGIAPRTSQPSSFISNFSSTAGDLATLSKPEKTDATSAPWSFADEFGTPHVVQVHLKKSDVKIDSKYDFQSFLRAAAASSSDEADIDRNVGSRRRANGVAGPTKSLIQAYGGIAGSGNRRYMTVPATTLSTILEQGDDASVRHDSFNDTEGNSAFSNAERDDTFLAQGSNRLPEVGAGRISDDGDLVSGVSQRSTKQMRRPRVTKGGSLDAETMKKLTPRASQTDFARLVPTSDDDVTTMGDAFLDRLSQSFGTT